MELWDLGILEGIGNTIRTFVKVAESTKRGRYTSYARLCIYMNIAEPLSEYIKLEYHDEIWQQPIDYEHIPFRCRRCHEYGHLFKQCPLNKEEETPRKQGEEQRRTEETDEGEKGFQEIYRKKRLGKEKTRIQQSAIPVIVEYENKFQALQEEEEEPEKEENVEEPMEIVKEKKESDINQKGKAKEGVEESMEMTVEQPQMEIEV